MTKTASPTFLHSILLLWKLRRRPLETIDQLTKTHGDIVHIRIGGQDFWLANDPDAVREILITKADATSKPPMLKRAKCLMGEGLITSEGAIHNRQKRIMTPAFKRTALAQYGDIIVEEAEKAVEEWLVAHRIDLERSMKQISLRILGRVFFGIRLDACDAIDLPSLESASTRAVRSLRPFAMELSRPRRFRRLKRYLDEVVDTLLEHDIDPSETTWTPLAQILRDARDEDGDGSGMERQLLHDEFLTLLLAGHETVAQAMTWCWYLLCKHPGTDAVALQEIDAILGHGQALARSAEQLSEVKALISESMRLYPPIWVMGRTLDEDLEFGGHTFRSGSAVAVSQMLLHRHPSYWADPNEFIPSRWTQSTPPMKNRYAYFPFGVGPRHCLGEAFAWIEAVLVTAVLMSRVQIEIDCSKPLELDPAFTLQSRDVIWASVRRRAS